MEQEKFDEIYRELKLGLYHEKQLETEILIKQHELDLIREKKTKLIIAIANKEMYNQLFGEEQNDK